MPATLEMYKLPVYKIRQYHFSENFSHTFKVNEMGQTIKILLIVCCLYYDFTLLN